MSDPKPQAYPLAPATTLPRNDEESATSYRSEQAMKKKKKRMKCLAYLAAFVVLQTVVIVVFSVVFLRVKTPKVRLEDVTISKTGNNGNGVSFSARVAVKNTNYGRYKFDSSLATITSENGLALARLAIPGARAGARSTKRILVTTDLSSAADSNGNLAVRVVANLTGKVELLRIMKRKKSTDMFCTMIINLPTNSVQNLACK